MTDLLAGLRGDAAELGGLRALFVHAHPDDETLQTGSLITALTSQNVVVDLVTATRGEAGEIVDGVLPQTVTCDDLVRARMAELADASKILGIRLSFMLGQSPARAADLVDRRYLDSGMRWISEGQAGPAEDVDEESLTLSDLDEEVADLLAVIDEVNPNAIISYDDAGSYGHPDHVRVHQIAQRAAEQAGITRYEIASWPDDEDFEYFDLSAQQPTLVAALQCYRTQLTVHEDHLTHVGGQDQEFPIRIGLRQRKPASKA